MPHFAFDTQIMNKMNKRQSKRMHNRGPALHSIFILFNDHALWGIVSHWNQQIGHLRSKLLQK